MKYQNIIHCRKNCQKQDKFKQSNRKVDIHLFYDSIQFVPKIICETPYFKYFCLKKKMFL